MYNRMLQWCSGVHDSGVAVYTGYDSGVHGTRQWCSAGHDGGDTAVTTVVIHRMR